MAGSVLRVNHWRMDCVIAREHPSPARAQGELGRVLDRLPDALATGLAQWFDHGDEIVLIRDLAFELELDLSDAADMLVARCAHRFARLLIDAVEQGDQAMRFRDTAAYHARFIADLAAGRAWHAWYYRSFEGLRTLPASSAIRTLLLEDLQTGRDTLAAFPPETWRPLSAVLTTVEAERIVRALCDRVDDAPIAVSSLLKWADRAADAVPTHGSAGVRALAVVQAALLDAATPSTQLAQWALLVGDVLDAVSGGDHPHDKLRDGDIATLAGVVRSPHMCLALAAHPHWRPALARVLAPATTAMVEPAPLHTGFAGLALLLPELDAVLDHDVSAALPALTDATPRQLAGWLALAYCAGAGCCAGVLREPFWRDFFTLPPTIDRNAIAAWLDEADATAALDALAARAHVQARGDVVLARLRDGDAHAWLQVDRATGLWRQWRDATSAPSLPSLSASREARSDWRHLNANLGLPAPWQRVFVQMAQVTLRRFAYRIPGFARTSLPHLRDNVLTATGHADGDTLRLTRPPLYTLLNLTGLSRTPLHWSGPPARTLRPEFLP